MEIVDAKKKIFLSAPDVGIAEEESLLRAVRSGWVAPLGPEVDAFESEIADFVGAKHAVALNSGTAALHLALRAFGIGAGDSVITSTMTFVATANSISYTGAKPLFVDSLADGTIDSSLVEEVILEEEKGGRRVSAILPVDVYGRAANYSKLLPIAAAHGIPIITDSAEALGARHQNSGCGSIGESSILSFNGNKIMTTSGGGMFLTPNRELADYVRYLSSQARQPVAHYEHLEIGYNYRMSNILAALGRAQLERLPSMISRRREIRKAYQEFFSAVDGVDLLHKDSLQDNCWLTAIVVDNRVTGWSPRELMAHLQEFQIESRPLWKPMHLQPLYKELPMRGGEISQTLFERGLILPSGSGMSDSDIGMILEALESFLSAP